MQQERYELGPSTPSRASITPTCEKSMLADQYLEKCIHCKSRMWQSRRLWAGGNTVGLKPLYFQGPMASELLNGLICTCKRGEMCTSLNTCSCSQKALPCIELCSCKGAESCCNAYTHANISDDPAGIAVADETNH